jgi:hypothetical protein
MSLGVKQGPKGKITLQMVLLFNICSSDKFFFFFDLSICQDNF